jgi:hypothetical protein
MKRNGKSIRRESNATTKQAPLAAAPSAAVAAEVDERRDNRQARALERRAERLMEELTARYVAGNRWCIKRLEWVTYGLLARLATLADCGDQEAARALASVVRHGVRRLDHLADTRPELLRVSAGLLEKWPGFLTVDREQERKNKQRIARLGVGSWKGINYEGKTWNRQTAEVVVALELEGEVGSMRHKRVPWRKERKIERESDAREKARALAQSLQPLSRANYVEWWRAAEPLFMEKYGPAFEQRSEFKHYWQNVAYKGERNARALIRRDIKAKMKQAFRSIAAKRPRSAEEQPFGGKTPPDWALQMADIDASEAVARIRIRERDDARLAKKVNELKKAGAKQARGERSMV